MDNQAITFYQKVGGDWIDNRTNAVASNLEEEIKKISSHAITFCVNQITPDYAKDALTGADVIVISRDRRGDAHGSTRGFAALKLNEETKEVLY